MQEAPSLEPEYFQKWELLGHELSPVECCIWERKLDIIPTFSRLHVCENSSCCKWSAVKSSQVCILIKCKFAFIYVHSLYSHSHIVSAQMYTVPSTRHIQIFVWQEYPISVFRTAKKKNQITSQQSKLKPWQRRVFLMGINTHFICFTYNQHPGFEKRGQSAWRTSAETWTVWHVKTFSEHLVAEKEIKTTAQRWSEITAWSCTRENRGEKNGLLMFPKKANLDIQESDMKLTEMVLLVFQFINNSHGKKKLQPLSVVRFFWTVMVRCLHNTHCEHEWFLPTVLFQGGIIIQHKSLMTLKSKNWIHELKLFWIISNPHRVKYTA